MCQSLAPWRSSSQKGCHFKFFLSCSCFQAVCKDNGFFNYMIPSWFSTTKHIKALTQRFCSQDSMLCSKTPHDHTVRRRFVDSSQSFPPSCPHMKLWNQEEFQRLEGPVCDVMQTLDTTRTTVTSALRTGDSFWRDVNNWIDPGWETSDGTIRTGWEKKCLALTRKSIYGSTWMQLFHKSIEIILNGLLANNILIS